MASVFSAVRRYIDTETAGGAALLAATVVALVWANSPWQDAYRSLWQYHLLTSVGGAPVPGELRELVNAGLMTVFFLVAGLEIKRELLAGELASFRVAALPVFAAAGGMAVPALAFATLTAGTGLSHGWGIPMATDIAFALAVLAVAGRNLPASAKAFLLTLAIVDDIGAVLVITLFYGDPIHATALAVALGCVSAVALCDRLLPSWAKPILVAASVAGWYATYRSGVHASIFGVALAFALHAPAERLEDLLHPVSSYAVLPCFALANAGIVFHRGMLDAPGAPRLVASVAVALVAGKFVGIALGGWLAVRLGIAARSDDLTGAQLTGLAAIGGVGFTVSIFVSELAFSDAELVDAAKLGVLIASVVAALVGGLLLRGRAPSGAERGGQLRNQAR